MPHPVTLPPAWAISAGVVLEKPRSTNAASGPPASRVSTSRQGVIGVKVRSSLRSPNDFPAAGAKAGEIFASTLHAGSATVIAAATTQRFIVSSIGMFAPLPSTGRTTHDGRGHVYVRSQAVLHAAVVTAATGDGPAVQPGDSTRARRAAAAYTARARRATGDDIARRAGG